MRRWLGLGEVDSVRFCLALAERLLVVGLFALLASRICTSVAEGLRPANMLVLVSEGLVVVLVVVHRVAKSISAEPLDWALAFAATAGPMLVRPGSDLPPLVPGPAVGLMLTGILFQAVSKLTLRRSFGIGPANRGLIVAGPYQLVRHPIYASYLIGQTGFLLLNMSMWNVCVLTVSLLLQLLRIAAEERLLANDEAHQAFRKAVPYRLVPGIY